jgi:hypothetical protein
MNLRDPANIFLAFIIVTTLAGMVILTLPTRYVYTVLLIVFIAVALITRTRADRPLYLCFTGSLLVMSVSVYAIGLGLVLSWLLAGMVLVSLDLLSSTEDWRSYLTFCGIAVVVAGITVVSSHVFLPLALFTLILGILLLVLGIREYRFRRSFTGSEP